VKRRIRSIGTSVLEAAGAGLVVCGVWMISVPLALVIAGVLLVVAGVALS
jgi:hypothetical protein